NRGLNSGPCIPGARSNRHAETTAIRSIPGWLLQVPGTRREARSTLSKYFRAPDTNDFRVTASIDTFTEEDELVGLLHCALEGPDGANSLNELGSDDIRSLGCRSSSSNSSRETEHGCDA